MTGAIVSFTSMAVAGRAIRPELDTFELMMYRSLIGILIVVVIAASVGKLGEINFAHFKTHIVRNLFHFAGQNLWFAALTMVTLAELFALEFTSPIWVALLSPIFLKEALTRTRLLVVAIGFLGVIIVTRPDLGNFNVGLVIAAGAAVGFAGSAIFTKILTRTVSITCILFWLVVMQAVFGVATAGWDGVIAWPSSSIWGWIALVSVAGLTAHYCLTKALSLAPAAVIMPVDFLRLPVIAVIGALAYAEALDPLVFVGAAVIFVANYINISVESRRAKQLP